jgi:putative oxidoreductase
MVREISLQRLFSTFANGLPGLGLMLQRLVTAAILVYGAAAHLNATPQITSVGPQLIDTGMGILLLVGLWTPVIGAMVAGRELWIMLSSGGDPRMPLVLATLGITLAMIGPGAWSIDARLFGRRQIKRLR